jgi:hypothetical protein
MEMDSCGCGDTQCPDRLHRLLTEQDDFYMGQPQVVGQVTVVSIHTCARALPVARNPPQVLSWTHLYRIMFKWNVPINLCIWRLGAPSRLTNLQAESTYNAFHVNENTDSRCMSMLILARLSCLSD